MRKILVPRFGDRRMDSVKTGEIQTFLMSLIGSREKGKISRQTALKDKIYLSSMFSAAIRLESGVIRNPVRSVRLTVEEPAKPAFVLDDLQTQQIADSPEDPRHKMMWNMNLWMGNRIGETSRPSMEMHRLGNRQSHRDGEPVRRKVEQAQDQSR